MIDIRARALLFDCDGTLVDSMPIHIAAWCETFQRHGLHIVAKDIDDFAGKPSEEVARCIARRYQKEVDIHRIADEKNKRVTAQLVHVKPIEPVVRIVKEYAGRLPMAVVSGSRRTIVDMELRAIGLLPYFAVIITPEDGHPSKPSPVPFLAAARFLQVQPEFCQVFEDGEAGLQGARAAGMIATDIRTW